MKTTTYLLIPAFCMLFVLTFALAHSNRDLPSVAHNIYYEYDVINGDTIAVDTTSAPTLEEQLSKCVDSDPTDRGCDSCFFHVYGYYDTIPSYSQGHFIDFEDQ